MFHVEISKRKSKKLYTVNGYPLAVEENGYIVPNFEAKIESELAKIENQKNPYKFNMDKILDKMNSNSLTKDQLEFLSRKETNNGSEISFFKSLIAISPSDFNREQLFKFLSDLDFDAEYLTNEIFELKNNPYKCKRVFLYEGTTICIYQLQVGKIYSTHIHDDFINLILNSFNKTDLDLDSILEKISKFGINCLSKCEVDFLKNLEN